MGPDHAVARGDAVPPRPRSSRRPPTGSLTSSVLIGRDAELARLQAQLARDDVRLITITGRSGAGKTRLATEAAARMAGAHPGGAVQVDLAGLDGAAQVEAAVAAALQLRVVTGADPRAALVNRLCALPTLLVLDDADLVVDGVELLVDLLGTCEGTHLLVTAATPLRIQGEQIVRLGPLALPDERDRDPQQLLRAPAVALFCERAEAVDGGFRCTPTTVRDVAALVGRLDGLPFAIELSAARVAALPPAAQLRMLGEGGDSPLDLRSASGVGTGRVSRRHDLRASIGWSHGFLDEQERIVLRRLSVFAGAPSADMIRAVCAERDWDAWVVMDAIATLVDVHLVDREPTPRGGEPRFRLLPIVAAFGREQLAAAGEEEALRERHAQAYAALARRVSRQAETEVVEELRADREDLHAALGHLVDRGDVAAGLRLAADLALLWMRAGFYAFQRAWLDRLLAAAARTPDVTRAELGTAYLWRALLAVETPAEHGRPEVATWLREGFALAFASDDDETRLFAYGCRFQTVFLTRDLDAAASGAREGLALATRRGDARWMTRFLCWAGMMTAQAGDASAAAGLLAQALHLAIQRRDRHQIVIASLSLLAIPEGTPGRPDLVPPLPALLELCREARDPLLESWVLARLAWTDILGGRVPDGVRWCIEGLRVARLTGALSSAGFPTLGLAMVAFGRRDDLTVARLYGAVAPAISGLALGLQGRGMGALTDVIAKARERAGAEAFDAAAAGAALASLPDTIDTAMAFATTLLEGTGGPAALPLVEPAGAGEPAPAPAETVRRRRRRGAPANADGTEPLTTREQDVLRLLAKGDSNKQIAEALGLRPKTVMHHSVSIYDKLGVRGRAEATAWAYRSGMLTD